MTGRGAGFCAGFNTPGYMNPWQAGFGRGAFGRGRGFRWVARATGLPGWYRAGLPAFGRWPAQIPVQTPVQPVQPTREQELQFLEQEKTIIEEEMKTMEKSLEEIKKRIEELKKK
jgi:hypothetical protein